MIVTPNSFLTIKYLKYKDLGNLHSLGLFFYYPERNLALMEESNLWDDEHPEWFIYDPELLNAWYWDEFIKEYDEND